MKPISMLLILTACLILCATNAPGFSGRAQPLAETQPIAIKGVLDLTGWDFETNGPLKLKGEWAGAKGEKFDTIGSLIYGFGIIALIYGLTRLSTFKGLCLIIFGIFVMYAFVKWESRVKSPVFQLKLFKDNRVFAFSNLAALILCKLYSQSFILYFVVPDLFARPCFFHFF